MRYFVRQTIKGRRYSALNQSYISTISDEVFINISKELDINRNICETLNKNFEFTNKNRKVLENENDSQ